MDAPNEFQPLMDDIFREKVQRARAAKSSDVLSLEGFDLFEMALAGMRSGARSRLPAATAEEIESEVRRLLQIKRRLDEYGFYQAAQ